MTTSGTGATSADLQEKGIRLTLYGKRLLKERLSTQRLNEDELIPFLKKAVSGFKWGRISLSLSGTKLSDNALREFSKYILKESLTSKCIVNVSHEPGYFDFSPSPGVQNGNFFSYEAPDIKEEIKQSIIRNREHYASNRRWAVAVGIGLALGVANPFMVGVPFWVTAAVHISFALMICAAREFSMFVWGQDYQTPDNFKAVKNLGEKEAFINGYKAGWDDDYGVYLNSYTHLVNYRHWCAFQGGLEQGVKQDETLRDALGLTSLKSPTMLKLT